MNDPHFAMSIYEEAGDVYFKGHRNQMGSLPFYRVPMINYYYFLVYTLVLYQNFLLGSNKGLYSIFFSLLHRSSLCSSRMAVSRLQEASKTSIQSSDS